jgi:hypothetical protein
MAPNLSKLNYLDLFVRQKADVIYTRNRAIVLGWEMSVKAIDPKAEIERTENAIQLVMAAVVPGVLAAMLFSYILFDELTLLFLALSIIIATFMIIPARHMHNLHFKTWVRNSLPTKLITSVVGMVYIAAISVFIVSLLSFRADFNPEHPATFAVEGGLLLSLIGLMSYQSKNKERFLSSEKRFFSTEPKQLEERVVQHLRAIGHSHKRSNDGSSCRLDLPESGLSIRILPLSGKSTEVLLENINEKNSEIALIVKGCLEHPT